MSFIRSIAIVPAPLGESDVGQIIIISLLLILLVFAGFFAVMRLRRWLKDEDVSGSPTGFTLGDLRELHRRGKMTTEEYERARTQMLSGAREMAEKMPHPLSRPGKER